MHLERILDNSHSHLWNYRNCRFRNDFALLFAICWVCFVKKCSFKHREGVERVRNTVLQLSHFFRMTTNDRKPKVPKTKTENRRFEIYRESPTNYRKSWNFSFQKLQVSCSLESWTKFSENNCQNGEIDWNRNAASVSVRFEFEVEDVSSSRHWEYRVCTCVNTGNWLNWALQTSKQRRIPRLVSSLC